MYSELLQDLTLHQRIFKAEYITVEYLTVMIRVVLCLMYLLNNQLSTGTLSAESVPFFIGEVMKKERKNRHCNHVSYDEYPFEDTPVRQLLHFSSHDKLYCIWNFVKHNSISTYKTLKERFPDVVIDQEFKQGDNALYYVNFSEELILDLISGLTEFFKEYCQLMFGENYEQAQWNYNDYFLDIVRDNIELITNPLGLQWWDELD